MTRCYGVRAANMEHQERHDITYKRMASIYGEDRCSTRLRLHLTEGLDPAMAVKPSYVDWLVKLLAWEAGQRGSMEEALAELEGVLDQEQSISSGV